MTRLAVSLYFITAHVGFSFRRIVQIRDIGAYRRDVTLVRERTIVTRLPSPALIQRELQRCGSFVRTQAFQHLFKAWLVTGLAPHRTVVVNTS